MAPWGRRPPRSRAVSARRSGTAHSAVWRWWRGSRARTSGRTRSSSDAEFLGDEPGEGHRGGGDPVGQVAGAERLGAHFLVEVGADLAHLRLADTGVRAQRCDQVVDLAGGHAVQVGLHHDGEQGLVDPAAALEHRREDRPGAQFRDPQFEVSGGGRQDPRPVTFAWSHCCFVNEMKRARDDSCRAAIPVREHSGLLSAHPFGIGVVARHRVRPVVPLDTTGPLLAGDRQSGTSGTGEASGPPGPVPRWYCSSTCS